MKKLLLIIPSLVCVLWLVSFVAYPVYAHGDEPRLEISVERVNPGGVVEVRGVDFEFETTVTLMLVNSKSTIPLGEVTADIEGVFLQIVTVPVDLPEGVYNFLAITDDHNITSPDLTVAGAPIYGESGGQGAREDEDPLLAPMPTSVPGVAPATMIPQTVANDKTQALGAKSSGIVIVILILLLGGGIVFVQKRRAS